MENNLTKEEILKEMGWTITCQSPYEIEHEDGSTARGSATQLVVDGIIQEYHDLKEEERKEQELSKKLEITRDLNINLINGNEIIEFLNKKRKDDEDDDFCDISISGFKFGEQKVEDDKYTLIFTGVFDNWGTDQDIEGNEIRISKKGIKIRLSEPFEGDGTDDAIEEVLSAWLKTHKFDSNPEEKFYKILEKAFDELGYVKFADKKELQKVIDQLEKAKTYMK